MKLRNLGYAAIALLVAVAFAIGSAVPSEAKAKKKKAEAAPPPVTCWIGDKKVCGAKGGMKFTYQNACYAAKDGAKVVSDKACPEKAAKPAKKGGKKKAMKKKK